MDGKGDAYFDKEFNELIEGLKESSEGDDKLTSCLLAE